MLDINKLHDVIEGRIKHGRGCACGCSQTTAMLVTALGLADFDIKQVFILCGTSERAAQSARQAETLAFEMGFTNVKRMVANIIMVENTLYCFRALLHPVEYPDAPTFYDYACGGIVMNHTPPAQEFFNSEERWSESQYKKFVLGEWSC